MGENSRYVGPKYFLARRQIQRSREGLRWKVQQLLKARPFKAGTGVEFAARGNVLMPCDVGDGVVLFQFMAQLGQALVLGVFKVFTL